MIRTQGIQYFLELANGLQSKPANYYIGLCEEDESEIAGNAVLADLTELSALGYARYAVAANSTSMISGTWGTNGRSLTTEQALFTADGGTWNKANTLFLATSIDDSGKLLATQTIDSGSGVTLEDGKSFACTMTIAAEP